MLTAKVYKYFVIVQEISQKNLSVIRILRSAQVGYLKIPVRFYIAIPYSHFEAHDFKFIPT